MDYKCPLCGSNDVVMIEWLGAYDGWMAISCRDCKKDTHRMTRTEIISATQRKDYGLVDFVLTDGRRFVNLFEENSQ